MPSRTRRIRGGAAAKLQRNRGNRYLGLATANVEIMPMNVATPLQLNMSMNGPVQALHHSNINAKTRGSIGSYNSRLNNSRKRASLSHVRKPIRYLPLSSRKNRRTRK